MTSSASLLNDALKNFPNGSPVCMSERNLISVNGKLYLPKRVIFNTVKLYNNDLSLAENNNIFLLCLDANGKIVCEVPLKDVAKALTNTNAVILKGVKFIYCGKVVESGEYFKVTVKLPKELKPKIDKAVNSGLFSSIDQVIEFALRRLFKVRRRCYEV